LWADLLAFTVYWVFGRLRRVGERNLEMALPNVAAPERNRILRGVYTHLGWQLVEFCRMTRYTPEDSQDWMRSEGLEHYVAAQARGNGVLVITGHLGAWELSSFYHSMMGYPMGMVIRRLDNRRLDAFVNGIRCLHGNYVLHKDDFADGDALRWNCGHSDGHEHDSAAGRVCEVLRNPSVHGNRIGPRGAQDGCGGAAWLHAVGASEEAVRFALRGGGGDSAHGGCCFRHSGRDAVVHFGD
jgi:hypothetical protein